MRGVHVLYGVSTALGIPAIYVYTRGREGRPENLAYGSASLFVAALAIMPLSTLFIGVDLQGVNSMGYLALGYAALVGTFGFMLLSFHNVQRFGATAESMTLYVIPVVSGLGGVLVLGEQITAGMMTGIVLIGTGITLINRR